MPIVGSHIPSAAVLAASEGSFLIKPGIGLMIWTLVVFFVTFLLLKRIAFPAISQALDKRQKSIEESIDTAERTRQDADKLLAEYRERLKEARAQADEIVQRARQTADTHETESKQHGQELIAEAQQRAEREIQAATERAISDLRREVADLTVTATEKVTKKALSDADQRRLVDEALAELDFSELSGSAS
jgi:F-type H+-transporting ATPase subunit b